MFGFLSGRCSLGSHSRKKQTDSLRERQTHKFLFGKFTTNFSEVAVSMIAVMDISVQIAAMPFSF